MATASLTVPAYISFQLIKQFNVEKVQYKNVIFMVWDVGVQEKLRPLWRHYFNDRNGLVRPVDKRMHHTTNNDELPIPVVQNFHQTEVQLTSVKVWAK
ncbi:hypothetical protein CTI12_AA391100 [Artemisia annua]|uniref:ADP-ribosylation factor n=1 Tax=Artemisia annua TaxID=35608 RepID=A0A2U1MCQ5_ARTAN|nr:hypothetical protein CTI12_AA391100 [Artemisia annua]